MSRTRTPTFVLELPLSVDGAAERALRVRFEAARHLYNACLGEALRRLRAMQSSDVYRQARALPAGPARREAYRLAARAHGFTEYALHAWAARCKNACWIGEHLDANVVQTLASRAFDAVLRYALGRRGRPRFKGRLHALGAVEGKTNAAGIRWRDGQVLWRGLVLRARLDPRDRDGVQAFALQRPVKRVRLVRRRLRGRLRWYVQLVLEGRPRWKPRHRVADGVVGLDVGPSTVAAVGADAALLERFCDEVVFLQREIRRILRAMDRSRRATNPGNYLPDGTVRPGRKRWVFSRRYVRLLGRLQELHRRMAAARRTAHGRLAHRILAMGRVVRTERLDYRPFQRRFGRSVRDRAPGAFLALLRRKAASAGGAVEEFATRETRLSRTCHCGRIEPKPLAQRWHRCPCGTGPVQRDLYSAYLARFVENGRLDTSRAAAAWAGAESLLRDAVSRLEQSASGRALPASFGLGRRRSGSHPEGRSCRAEAAAAPQGRRAERCGNHGQNPLA